MTIKEKLAAKQAELAELKSRIEAGEAEAIELGENLVSEIESLEADVARAEKSAAILGKIGQKSAHSEEKNGIKLLDIDALKGKRGMTSTYIKAYNDVESTTTIETIDKNIVDARTPLNVRALFGAEKINGNALTYYVLSAAEGEIGTTSEGTEKDQIHIPYTEKTVALAKIAAYIKETEELLSDADFLESAIRNRGIYDFNKAVEAYLVNTLTGTSGVQVYGNSITFDNILAAKQDVIADTGYTPDAMLINPADWATLLQSKDSNNQYLLGGPAFGSYGNGNYFSNPKVWGMTVVESDKVIQGTVILGAFKPCASVVSKANEGQRVELSNSDQDDFINNRVTIRIEERLALAVRVPAAFCIVGAES